MDPTERQFIDDVNGGISTIRGIYNYNDNNDFIIYNTSNALVYQRMEGLTPYYNKMMSGELNEKLNQWMKQMPGESLEEYTARVNEESRREMAMELEREIATKMAVGLLEQSDVTVGDYNTKTKKLTLHFSSMPDIFLDVPLGEIKAFDKSSRLEFRNVKYGLNPDDKFEIVYAEVYNPENGKTYIFDNLERKSLRILSVWPSRSRPSPTRHISPLIHMQTQPSMLMVRTSSIITWSSPTRLRKSSLHVTTSSQDITTLKSRVPPCRC